MTANIPIALSLIFLGVSIIAISVPLLQGKVKRNSLYGIRTPQAFKSDELWFQINRYGARQLIFWAVVIIALGIVTLFLSSTTPGQLVVWLSLGTLLPLLFACVQIFRYSSKL